MNTWRTCRIDTSLSPKGIVCCCFPRGPSIELDTCLCVCAFLSKHVDTWDAVDDRWFGLLHDLLAHVVSM